MALTRSPDLAALSKTLNEGWSRGEGAMIEDARSRDEALMLGGPAGAPWVGQAAVLDALRRFVPKAGAEGVSHTRIDAVEAFADGDIGWSCATGAIALPAGDRGYRADMVFRREAGAWRWIQWCSQLG